MKKVILTVYPFITLFGLFFIGYYIISGEADNIPDFYQYVSMLLCFAWFMEIYDRKQEQNLNASLKD